MAAFSPSGKHRSPNFKRDIIYHIVQVLAPLLFLLGVTLGLVLVAGIVSFPYPQLEPSAPWLVYDGRGIPVRSKCGQISGVCDEFAPNFSKSEYFLSAVIFNRVFSEDLFGITAYECKQWIEFMLYAGVEHIFWYDTAHSDAESQEKYLADYIRSGLLTYHRFHHLFPGNLKKGYNFEQDNSYHHFLREHKQRTNWVLEMDVDEYPFSPEDTESCFLQRLLREWQAERPGVTQILVQCMIFGGNPKGEKDGWVIDRYGRRKPSTEGVVMGSSSRQKPLLKTEACDDVTPNDPHIFRMEVGETVVANAEKLRMNHYWGARLTNFGPDTPEVLAMLRPDASMSAIASQIRLNRPPLRPIDSFAVAIESIRGTSTW